MTPTRRAPRRSPDSGAALVFALLFITAIGLISGSLLGYTSATITAGARLDQRATADNEVSGALATAVNDIRRSSYEFGSGTDRNCLAGGTSRGYPASSSTSSSATVVVTCAPGPATGDASGAVVITTANRPANAVLAVGTSTAEPGVQTGTHLLRVSGPVFSHTDVRVTGTGCPVTPQPPTNPGCSELYVTDGQVKARTGCTGRVVSTPPPACSVSGSDPDGADPGYPAPPAGPTDLVYRDVATCTSGSAVLQLQPGYYDDAVALSSWTSGSCGSSKTVWLQPGTYYFDFRNSQMAGGGSTAVPRAADVWTISSGGVEVVGGTKKGWTTGPISAGLLPGGCVSPLESSTAQGVRLLFGGDSRIVQTDGVVELCGSYSASGPPLVLQGATADSAGVGESPTLTPPPTLSVSGSSTTMAPTGSQAVAAVAGVDSQVVSTTVARPTSGTRTGTVSLRYTPTVPAGSVLVSSVLSIKHRESSVRSGSADAISVTATPTPGAAGPPQTLPPATGPAGATVPLDLGPTLVQSVHDSGLSGLSVRYEITAAARTGSGSAANTTLVSDLDAVTLTLTYRPPSVRGQRTSVGGSANCVGTVPYLPAGSNCALLDLSGEGAQFYVQGGIYAPYAALDLALPEEGGCSTAQATRCQLAKAGIVARSVRFDIPDVEGSVGSTSAVETPVESTGPQPLDVYLTAYLCPPGSTCTGSPPGSTWRKAGTALARFVDPGTAPVAGQRAVSIRSWNLRP